MTVIIFRKYDGFWQCQILQVGLLGAFSPPPSAPPSTPPLAHSYPLSAPILCAPTCMYLLCDGEEFSAVLTLTSISRWCCDISPNSIPHEWREGCFFKLANLGLFFVLFALFNQIFQFLIIWKSQSSICHGDLNSQPLLSWVSSIEIVVYTYRGNVV